MVRTWVWCGWAPMPPPAPVSSQGASDLSLAFAQERHSRPSRFSSNFAVRYDSWLHCIAMNGVIVIDKPAGPTSAQVVRQMKARLGKRTRVGHLGTLDPFATGVLPILIGDGTKLALFLEEGIKEYVGSMVLGYETDTLDSTGT